MSADKFVTVGNIQVRVIKGIITDQQVDVIVNSNGPDLDLSKGRASNALLSAAGGVIQTECVQGYPNGIQDGEIAITSGGQLSCKAIYHGALSKYSSVQDEQTLQTLIHACLDQANTNEYRTIAIPALGTGFLAYPVETVASIMFDSIHKCAHQSLKEVRIVIYTSENACFKKFLAEARTYLPKGKEKGSQSKGNTDGHKIGNLAVEVVVGTLSSVQADVLVCSGPKDLQLNNGALSKALLEVAGDEMQEELSTNYPNGIDFGECAISKGFNLSCRFVYHGAVPKWGSNTPDPSFVLKKFMYECLEEANKHSTKSIAFPTLGLGALQFPVDQTVKLMVQTLRTFSRKHRQMNINKVVIVVYSESKDCSTVKSTLLKELNSPTVSAVSKSVYSGKIDNVSINVIVGSITGEQVDVLVNSVSTDLGMTSGTAAAVSAAAGPGMTNEIAQDYPNGITYDDVAVTSGHNLTTVKKIYHGALLPWYSKRSGSTKLPDELLEEFVLKCLQKANSSGHSSIAFPALGTGYHKFPADVASASMVSAFDDFCKQTKNKTVLEIRVVLFASGPDLQQLEKAFQDELGNLSPGNSTKESGAAGKQASNTKHIPLRRRVPTVAPKRGTKPYLIYKYQEAARTPPYWTKFTCQKKLKDWNLAVKSGASSHMENVDQNTFQSIEAAFKCTLGGAQIVSIHRIENVELFLKYTDECQRLFRKAIVEGDFVRLENVTGSSGPAKTMQCLDSTMLKHTHPEINEYYFFHGTKPQSVAVISGQGLDNRLAYTGGLLGTGVYGAEDASKSDGYTGIDTNGCRPMFLMRMCLGDIHLTRSTCRFTRPPCRICGQQVCSSHQEIFDSVVANFQFREFVVYDRSQCYPEYLIWYK